MNQHNPPRQGTNLASDVIKLMHDLLSWQEQIERAVRDLDYLYSFDDIVASVLRQERFLYQFDDCMVIMQVERYPTASCFHCFLAAGTSEGLFNAEPALAEIGKELGCKYFTFSGRAGWARKLKDRGWQQKLVIMHKEIV